MKASLLFFIFFLPAFAFSQSSTSTFLTWMKGDNTINQVGMYGTQGVAAAANKPGARDFSATWKDNTGNLWLFGGYGYDDNSLGYLNDLWKYNPSTNQWSWIKGDHTIGQPAVYGTQAVATSLNKPGAIYASISWTDNNGNLWLFGGFGNTDNDFGFLNDLWKYNPATNQWTWIKGDKTVDEPGVYGAQGTANNNNKPGARYGSRTWTDASGNLWLFGGYGLDNNGDAGMLNDLWKYNTTSNQWTWIKGDDVIDRPGVYGVQGVASATNKPGGRYVSVSWKDNSGNFWLFGGSGFNESTQGSLNDLWKYNPSTNQWTWIKGDKVMNGAGVYGTQGSTDANNKPGARYVSVSWTDMTGNLWLFGGFGYASGNEGYLNDLWRYNPSSNQWSWIKGDNDIDRTAVYGVQGMPSLTNKSGSRTSCVSWTGSNGDLWLFGGYGFDTNDPGILNDLWKISSMTSPLPLLLISFSGVLNNDITQLYWQTDQELNVSHFTVECSFDGLHFTAIGNVNATGNLYKTDYHFNDDIQTRPEQKVFYRLRMTDKDGHYTYSKIVWFDRSSAPMALHIFPNPAATVINVSFDKKTTGPVTIHITDIKGIRLLNQTENVSTGRASVNIDVSRFSAGNYILSLTNASGTIQQKLIIAQ